MAWLCEFRSLTKVERRCVLRVTLCRCADPAQAADAAEELLALASVFLANPATWTRIGGDALARDALGACARGVGAASTHVEGRRLAWRFLELLHAGLKSPVPEARAACAEAFAQEEFCVVAAALLFHRHDVGSRVTSSFGFGLGRTLDAAFACPELGAARSAIGTGFAKDELAERAWRGEPLVTWDGVVRSKARTLVEMDVGGSPEAGDDDGFDARDAIARDRLHAALAALDPTGRVLGATPLAEAGVKAARRARDASASAVRAKIRRERSERRKAKALARANRSRMNRHDEDDDADKGGGKGDGGSGSESSASGSDPDGMTEERLSAFAPDVLDRRRAVAHEARDPSTSALEKALAAARRHLGPRPESAESSASASASGPLASSLSASLHSAALYFGATAVLRRARLAHDRRRVTLARGVLDRLFDAALGGRGDALRRVPGGRRLGGFDASAEEEKRDGETEAAHSARLASRPAALGPGLAACAASALDALARQPGAAPAIVGSSAWTAAACRLSSGAAPPQVRSAGARLVAALMDRRRLRGRALETLGRVARRAATDPRGGGSGGVRETGAARDDHKNDDARDDANRDGGVSSVGFAASADLGASSSAPGALALAEDAEAAHLASRAIDCVSRLATRASRDRSRFSALAVRVAFANASGDAERVHGTRGERLRGEMSLKLRARAALHACRATDAGAIAWACRGVSRALAPGSGLPRAVRRGAASALGDLSTLLVAREIADAAVEVGASVGDPDAPDEGDAVVPAPAWDVPEGDWETARGPFDDCMVPEEVAWEEAEKRERAKQKSAKEKRSKKSKREGVKGGGSGVSDKEQRRERERDAAASDAHEDSEDSEDSDAAHEDAATGAHQRRRVGGGVWLAGAFSRRRDPSDASNGSLDVLAKSAARLERCASRDPDPAVRAAARAALDSVLESRACAAYAAARYGLGGVVGAHVAQWAALNPDRPYPPEAEALRDSKRRALVSVVRGRVAEARVTSRTQDERVGDVDAEAARIVDQRAKAATDFALARRGFHRGASSRSEGLGSDDGEEKKFFFGEEEEGVFGQGRVAGAHDVAANRERVERRVEARLAMRRAALRDAGLREDDPAAEEALAALVAAGRLDAEATRTEAGETRARRVVGPPSSAAPPPRSSAWLAPAANASVEIVAPPRTLALATGPARETMEEVKATLRDAVAAQHVKHETRSRARIANAWREAREKSANRKGLPAAPPGLSSASERHGPSGGGGGAGSLPPVPRRPVDVYHGLRDPSKARAIADGDPLAERRAAPPGGDIELSRPFASRPRLERLRAADAFRRDPAPGPSVAAIEREAARRAERRAERERRRADVSRRYFDGGEAFRRPAETTRAETREGDGERKVVRDSAGRLWTM